KLLPEWTWNYTLRRPITTFNPTRTVEAGREATEPVYSVFDYDSNTYEEKKFNKAEDCLQYLNSQKISWINMDGLVKTEIEKIGAHFDIHHLLAEDILSIGQRAKMDEVEGVIFCLLPMLYYNTNTGQVESEQVSIVLGDRFVISFQ